MSVDQITNYLKISEQIGSGGMPTRDQLADVRDAGCERVINLALETSPNALRDEAGLVHGLGMEYVHIPVVWEAPRLEDLEKFFAAMQESGNRKVFVHCVMNMRVTAFLFLYQVICCGTPVEAALGWMRRVWEPDLTWRAFIQAALEKYALTQEEPEWDLGTTG